MGFEGGRGDLVLPPYYSDESKIIGDESMSPLHNNGSRGEETICVLFIAFFNYELGGKRISL